MSEANPANEAGNPSESAAHRHGLEAFFAAAESAADAGIEIGVSTNCGFLNLRLDPRNEQAVNAAEQVLGQALPLVANTFSGGEYRVYWLGPDEWLIETNAASAVELKGELAAALTGCHAAVNDVSGGHVALRFTGAEARAILAKGCTLDLHPREFAPGQCARAGLGKTTVLLAPAPFAASDNVAPDGTAPAKTAPSYTIIVGRSFADYLCRWLAKAARPHGARFSTR